MAAAASASDDDKPRHHVRPSLRPLLLLTMVGTTALVVMGISSGTTGHGMTWYIVATLAAIILLGSTVLHIFLFHYQPTRQQFKTDNQIVDIGYESLLNSEQPFATTLSRKQLLEFVNSLIKPEASKARIVEEIHPLQRTLRQRVSTNVILSSAGSDDVLYPLIPDPPTNCV